MSRSGANVNYTTQGSVKPVNVPRLFLSITNWQKHRFMSEKYGRFCARGKDEIGANEMLFVSVDNWGSEI